MKTVKETVVVAVQSGAEKMAQAWEGGKEQLAAAVGAGAADVYQVRRGPAAAAPLPLTTSQPAQPQLSP